MDALLDAAANWLVAHHRVTAGIVIGLSWAASAYAGMPL